MKKFLITLMVLIFALSTFTACSSKDESGSEDMDGAETGEYIEEESGDDVEEGEPLSTERSEPDEEEAPTPGTVLIQGIMSDEKVVEITPRSIGSREEAIEYAIEIADEAELDWNYADNIRVDTMDWINKEDPDKYGVIAYEHHPDHFVTVFECNILSNGAVERFSYRGYLE